MIETSDAIDALSDAMAKAQATIAGAKKDSSNPHFKSRYADLASVWEAWQAVGPKQGLAVMQFPGECVNNQMAMTTLVTHASGQWIKSTLSIPLAKVDAQGYGSATTYARRYALAAAVGIAPEDDDGNAASNPKGANNDAARSAEPADSYPFPPGPAKGITELKTLARELYREVNGCGDESELTPLLDVKENAALMKQMASLENPNHAEIWLGDGKDNPGLAGLINRKQTEFAQLRADYMQAG